MVRTAGRAGAGHPFLRAYWTDRGITPGRQQVLLTCDIGGVVANLRSYVQVLVGTRFRITIELPDHEAADGERIAVTDIDVAAPRSA